MLLMMMMVVVMMMMMMASLTTGHCAPRRGPAHHSIQRTVVTLSLSPDGIASGHLIVDDR